MTNGVMVHQKMSILETQQPNGYETFLTLCHGAQKIDHSLIRLIFRM